MEKTVIKAVRNKPAEGAASNRKPSPTKLKKVSRKMAPGIDTMICVISIPMIFGRISLISEN